ncbi:hypothetical protein QZM22_13610 [Burkholderia oklahomensis]|uniref:hypothetical protein n=1 Tax=Burkholderia oklahomensis TaxID=342113 RepID=UPI002655FF16|nr:hypothetical protein [Burkholderia oklahomensis]MDN7673526.1 hypothetical protein [Burkholderia oklahomensis]
MTVKRPYGIDNSGAWTLIYAIRGAGFIVGVVYNGFIRSQERANRLGDPSSATGRADSISR